MRIVLQRVKKASVTIEDKVVAQIGQGLLILLGATSNDSSKESRYLADKCLNLRVFEDKQGKMNLSALDIGADFLVVSQFTLYADVDKGRRPSFTSALEPNLAEKLYLKFIGILKESGLKVEQGIFGAKMEVELTNWGPVTLILDGK